jgi:Mrp family chromosome partitioning ATPase
VQQSEWPNLYVVVSGPPPPSPAELLASPRLRLLNSEGTKYFDIVILDAPPVMGLADAPLIAATAVGTIAVIESGRTMRGPARAAIRRLRMTHAHLIGAILTKLDARQASYGYGYAYEYEYTYGQKRKGVTAELPLLSKQRKPPSAA